MIKAIGAGVNEWQVGRDDLARHGDFDLFLLAGRYTLLEQESLTSFLPLCVERGIGIVLGGPYNSGILATRAAARRLLQLRSGAAGDPRRVERIERVCKAHGATLAEAALRFPLATRQVVCVDPGRSAAAKRCGGTPPCSAVHPGRACGAISKRRA